MSVNEIKKETKIIHEFILYLMKHGVSDLNVDIKKHDKIIDIIIKSSKCDPNLVKKIVDRVGQLNGCEIEEYGWELMGESDESNELCLAGMLLDSFKVEDEDSDFTTFILKRVDKY